jgi:hypothetical protein
MSENQNRTFYRQKRIHFCLFDNSIKLKCFLSLYIFDDTNILTWNRANLDYRQRPTSGADVCNLAVRSKPSSKSTIRATLTHCILSPNSTTTTDFTVDSATLNYAKITGPFTETAFCCHNFLTETADTPFLSTTTTWVGRGPG